MVYKILCSTILVIALVGDVYSSENVELSCETSTAYGIVLGKRLKSRSDNVFCAFLGIPFAKPPIGDLRFLSPQTVEKWNGTKDAKEGRNVCLQRGNIGSEDCLYLNVFTHSTLPSKSSPVMVYIHGGGFYISFPPLKALGPEYFMDRDVVLVTLQYRLGVFGFLTTGDEVIPGNMGLKDQVEALQWVKGNIQAFGGDPNKVTIFGNSAGGSSVHFHMLAPASRGLFQRAISQSGTAFSGFALMETSVGKNVTEQLLLSLNCSIAETLQCLQRKSSLEVLHAYIDILNKGYDFNKILLRPVVDHTFITRHPKYEHTESPWLVGVSSHEAIYTIKLKKLNETIHFIKTEFLKFGPKILFFEDKYPDPDGALVQIYNYYFENSSNTEDIIQSLEKMLTDALFIWPTEQGIQRHQGTLFHYLYDHQVEHSHTEIFGCPNGVGVSHMDELTSLFNISYLPQLNEQDTKISKLMVDLWVSFATTGNPTPQVISSNPQVKETADFTWDPSNITHPAYLHIQTNKLSMKSKMFTERMELWKKLVQSLRR